MQHHAEHAYLECCKLFAMARCAAAPVALTTKHRRRLEAILRQRQAPQSLVLRARIILMADAGWGVRETARELAVGGAADKAANLGG